MGCQETNRKKTRNFLDKTVPQQQQFIDFWVDRAHRRKIIARSAITLDCASEKGCLSVVTDFWFNSAWAIVGGSRYCFTGVLTQGLFFFAVLTQNGPVCKKID